MQFLLFDIDGTLIRSGGAGKLALESALTRTFGVSLVDHAVAFAGRTDPAITHDLLAIHGIEPNDVHRARLMEAYLDDLPQALQENPGHVLPGVRDLLDQLKNAAVFCGLLTGNVKAGAERKLRHFGLWDEFTFGGFADGIRERDDIARRAYAELVALHGPIDPQNVWVIGDTPLDVKCARAIGAKAVAVGTGWHDEAELRASKPDFYFPDLTCAGEWVQAVTMARA